MGWRRETDRKEDRRDFGWAGVDLRDDVLYVQSYSRHPDGPYIANQWLRVLARDTDDTILGHVVLDALCNSEDGVKGLAEGRERALAALLRAAGVRSYRKYVTGTRSISVGVRPHGSSITLIPSHNGGPSGPNRGFHPIQELEFTIPGNSTDTDVGRATWTALEAAS